MKIGLICYHKNIDTLYPKKWIEEFKNSIDSQTYKDFIIYELNYGGGEQRIFPNSLFESKEFPTFVHGMNYLLDKWLVFIKQQIRQTRFRLVVYI